ncbi:hypothetical protein TruAng_005975 [Truncatella angustata]|nr:hypothetical protein TruAng_005975 [Truncatella angustata]
MPLTASPYKIAAAKRYGAKVILRGNNTADGALLAHKIVKLQNATLIPPSGDEDIMLGQATVMMEFADQIQDMGHQPLDLVLVPSAGGALLAGTGLICEGSGTLVIGTEPKNGGADLRIARQRGVRQGSINQDFTTIAEGLRSPTADFNWRFLCDSKYVRDVFGVTEDSIKITMRIMVEELKMVVEPSAAVSLSALLFNNDCLRLLSTRSSWRIGIIISGGNISVDKMLGLIQQ